MTNKNFYSKRSAILFVVLAIVFSAVLDLAICITKNESLIGILMWMPALAAFIAAFVAVKDRGEKASFRNIMNTLSFRKAKFKYLLWGCLIPLIYLMIPYVIFWLVFPDSLVMEEGLIFTLVQSLILLPVGTAVSMLTAIGEEIGWRGFEVPSLIENWGLKKTLIFSSGLWCLWHFPILLGTSYMEGTPVAYKLIAFTITIFPIGIICGLLTYISKSIWPAALIHAAHNNYDQQIFGPITVSASKMYYVSETGVITMVCAWTIAVLLYVYVKKHAKEVC